MSSKGKKRKTEEGSLNRRSVSQDDVAPDMEGEEEDEGEIRCICGFKDDDGFTIQCEKCLVWQHAVCVNITAETVPDQYYCEACRPRRLDAERAIEIQTKRVRDARKSRRKEEKNSPRKRKESTHQDQNGHSNHSKLIETSSHKRKQRKDGSEQPQGKNASGNMTPPRKKAKTAQNESNADNIKENSREPSSARESFRRSSTLQSLQSDQSYNSHEGMYESEVNHNQYQQPRNHTRVPSSEPFLRKRKKTWNNYRADPSSIFEAEYSAFLHDFALLRHNRFSTPYVRNLVSKFYQKNHKKEITLLPIQETKENDVTGVDLSPSPMVDSNTATPMDNVQPASETKAIEEEKRLDFVILPLSHFSFPLIKVVSQSISPSSFVSGGKVVGLFSTDAIPKGDLIVEIKGVVSLLSDLDAKNALLSCISLPPSYFEREIESSSHILPPFVFSHPNTIQTSKKGTEHDTFRLFVDAREYGDNDGRYVRSFCGNPNYPQKGNSCNAQLKTVLCLPTPTDSPSDDIMDKDNTSPTQTLLLPAHHQIRLCLFSTRDIMPMNEIILHPDPSGLYRQFPCICGEELEGCRVNEGVQSFEAYRAWNEDRDEETMGEIDGPNETLIDMFRNREEDRRIATEKRISLLENVQQAAIAARSDKPIEFLSLEEFEDSLVDADENPVNIPVETSNSEESLEKDTEKSKVDNAGTEIPLIEDQATSELPSLSINPAIARLKTPPPDLQTNDQSDVSDSSAAAPLVRKVSLRDFMMQRGINASNASSNNPSGSLNSPLGKSVIMASEEAIIEISSQEEQQYELNRDAANDIAPTSSPREIAPHEVTEMETESLTKTNESITETTKHVLTGDQNSAERENEASISKSDQVKTSAKTSFLDRYKSLVSNRELEPEAKVPSPNASIPQVSNPQNDSALVASPVTSTLHPTPEVHSGPTLASETPLSTFEGTNVERVAQLEEGLPYTHSDMPTVLPYGRSRESSVRSDYSDSYAHDRRFDADDKDRLTPPSGDRERLYDSMYNSSSNRRTHRLSLDSNDGISDEKDYRTRPSWSERQGPPPGSGGAVSRGDEYDFDRPGPPRGSYHRDVRDREYPPSRHRGYRPLYDAYPSSVSKRYRDYGPHSSRDRDWDKPGEDSISSSTTQQPPTSMPSSAALEGRDRERERERRLSDSREDRPGRDLPSHMISRSRSPSPSGTTRPPLSSERDRGEYYRQRFDGPPSSHHWDRDRDGRGPPRGGRFSGPPPFRGGPFRGGYRGRGRGRGGPPLSSERDRDRDERR